MVLQQINGSASTNGRHCTRPSLRASEGMLNAGVPAPYDSRRQPPDLMGARRRLLEFSPAPFRRHNRLFGVDVGKGGIHLRAIELPLPDGTPSPPRKSDEAGAGDAARPFRGQHRDEQNGQQLAPAEIDVQRLRDERPSARLKADEAVKLSALHPAYPINRRTSTQAGI